MALPLIPILGFAGQILDKLFPDPEEKAKAEAALHKAQISGELRQIEK